MTEPRHDRIIPLSELKAYPGREWLDVTLWLPPSDDRRRRMWLLIPAEAVARRALPEVRIDERCHVPRREAATPGGWLDYGVVEVTTGFSQLRVRGLRTCEAAASHLVISRRLDLAFDRESLSQAERVLWGLAREQAGRTLLSPSRLTTGSPADWHLRYSAGPDGLPAGALIRFSVPKAFDTPQADRPDAGGYVAVENADVSVAIVAIEPSVESHEKVDIICRLGGALGAGKGFCLRYRTEWTYIFPRRFWRVDRRYWYSKLAPLQAAAALGEDRPFVSLAERNGHTVEWLAGPAERLHLFLPGQRYEDEDLALRGLLTDRYRNVPPRGLIDADLDLVLVGKGGRRIALGSPAGHLTARHRFELPLPRLAPGVYRAYAYRAEGGDLLAQSNPLRVVHDDGQTPRIYWGEIHAHTEMSDGTGDFCGLYRHAREEGGLDFAAAADHACYFSDNEWLWMQDVTNRWNEPGRFVTLNGYEWAGKQVHRNIYTARDRLALFRGMYEPTSHLDAVWPAFHGDDQVVAGPHGSLAHGLVWEHHDPTVQRFAEIYSMWGASDRRDNPLVPDFARENPRGLSVNELLRRGARLGFTGGGDCHEGHAGFSSEDPDGQGQTPHTFAAVLYYRCGMTAATMLRLDRAELVAALRERRTYATTGARMLLQFSVSGQGMGGIAVTLSATCRGVVNAVDPIRRIEVLRDGDVVWADHPRGLDASFEWDDPRPLHGEHYYYLHVVQEDGQQAWSSPVWVQGQS